MQATQPPMTQAQLIDYCERILRERGHFVERAVPTGVGGDSLRVDLVTRTTVYEIRQFLTRERLYEGTGQGLVYAWWLRRRRLVVVGYLPQAAADQGTAITTAANIERTGYARISFIDVDPFWRLAPISYRPLWYTALLIGTIALAVFAIPLLREEVGCRVYPELEACAVDRVYRP